jgi:hypothetical protein
LLAYLLAGVRMLWEEQRGQPGCISFNPPEDLATRQQRQSSWGVGAGARVFDRRERAPQVYETDGRMAQPDNTAKPFPNHIARWSYGVAMLTRWLAKFSE